MEPDDKREQEYSAAMNLSEITPDWIATARDDLGLRNVDIAAAVGMDPNKFNKSMSGTRRFRVAELEAIRGFLGARASSDRDSDLAEISAMFTRLTDDQKAHIRALVRDLYLLSGPESK